jgi:hypothetical protein
MTLGALALPKCRINVGFLLVMLLIGEDVSFFFFLRETSILLADGKSMRPERLRVFVADVRGGSAVLPSGPSFRPFLRIVPLSPAGFEE